MAYAEKVYGLGTLVDSIGDGRQKPLIKTSVVFRATFAMALLRMSSLNALEQTSCNAFWKRWTGCALPSADTIGRVFTTLQCNDVRSALRTVYAREKRNKALKGVEQGLFALVIDGHESSASYLRTCPECLKRVVESRSGKRIQYYHRIVAAVLVSRDARILLDCELQKPGEDEVAAATRLLNRIFVHYPRTFDVVMGDGLYLKADFFKNALAHHKDIIAVLKDERRDLLKDARSLFDEVQPIEFRKGNTEYKCWDIEHFTSWSQLGRPVRVVRTLETTTVRRQRSREEEQQTSEWIWATTLPPLRASTTTVVRFGHARWSIENEGGFNELVNSWHANHVYKHRANAILAFWLTTMLAYNLFHAFLRLNLKPVLRSRHTAVHWARLLCAEFFARTDTPLCRSPT